MTLIKPFAGLRPDADRAADVAAPPYDVLSSAEARAQAAGKPWSFLHISKPEIDLPDGTDPFADEVYAKARENFDHMCKEGVLKQDSEESYYLYELTMGEHVQTGLVAAASVPDYDSNRIRKHEFTRPEKEDDRVRQISVLDAQTGPVFLTYRHDAEIDAIVSRVTQLEADIDITVDDGVRHRLWKVNKTADNEKITSVFDAMECLYIADGHHRSAAASRVAADRKANNPNHTGDESYNYFLTVIFPDNQMQILDYNRVVKDLRGLETEQFIEAIKHDFKVTPEDAPVKPAHVNEFGMYIDGQWYRLNINADRIPEDDLVARLDISLLADNLISPLLGVDDPRRDKRIDFVGGIRGLSELEKRVNSGDMAVAFSLYPTAMADLMAVADTNEMMPPKSTWFEPKLADGLVSYLLD